MSQQEKRIRLIPRFKVGDKVRVKPGISDPIFPEHASGWLGGDRHRDHQEPRSDQLPVQAGRSNSGEYAPDLPQAM